MNEITLKKTQEKRKPIAEQRGPLMLRLRAGADDDIRQAMDNLPDYVNRSEFLRTAVRSYLKQNKLL